MLAALALANRSSLAKTDRPTQRGDGFMRVHPSIVYVRKLLTIATSMLAGAGPYAPPMLCIATQSEGHPSDGR